MKRLMLLAACLCLLLAGFAMAEETNIVLGEGGVNIEGENSTAVVQYTQVETHEDVPEGLEGLENRVIAITCPGTYRISGAAQDTQISVEAGENDEVRIILDGLDLSCRTAPAIVVRSAAEPEVPNSYAVAIELADESVNRISGAHTAKQDEDDVKFDGSITSLVSLGFEGGGSLELDADNEGIEVKFGHMTINGGKFHIQAGDDPLNVSEDETGTLTINDGYLFSAVKPIEGGEGDGIDSNGYIVFNGGVAINLAHPGSEDSGIDSSMGSIINGGVVVGAGNMYDPVDSSSEQLFMMLEFAENTDRLVVVTDENDRPVFAYDFPHSYKYIAFSTPELAEGSYRVYLGGEIEGEQQDGLYTSITAYTPGEPMTHGGERSGRMMPGGMEGAPQDMNGMHRNMDFYGGIDLNEILAGADLNELLAGKDLNGLLRGFSLEELLTPEQMEKYLPDQIPDKFGGAPQGAGMPGQMAASAQSPDDVFKLSRTSTGFTGIAAKE